MMVASLLWRRGSRCCSSTIGSGKSRGRLASTADAALRTPAEAAIIASRYRMAHPTTARVAEESPANAARCLHGYLMPHHDVVVVGASSGVVLSGFEERVALMRKLASGARRRGHAAIAACSTNGQSK